MKSIWDFPLSQYYFRTKAATMQRRGLCELREIKRLFSNKQYRQESTSFNKTLTVKIIIND